MFAAVALVALAFASLMRIGRGPVSAQGLGRSDDVGAAAHDGTTELVAVEGSTATREGLAPTLAAPAERSRRGPVAMVSVLVRRVDERLAAPGVEGVTVSVVGVRGGRNRSSRLGVTDVRGELRAALPGPGRYELFIDPADVPRGLVAPGRYLVPAPTDPGVAATIVEVARGEEASATLFLNDARVVAGRVIGPDGEGLAGVVLRAAATAPGHQQVAIDFRSGADGVFALDPALPLEYVLRIVDLDAHAAALQRLPLPPPLLVDLLPGDVLDLELRVAAGRHLITGTIVDERGEPFPGVDVLALYSGLGPGQPAPRVGSYTTTWSDLVGTTVSDARGRFELGPVHSESLRIVIAGQAARSAGRGERLVAFGGDPIDVALDASAAASIDVGQVELTRSRTYTVSGTIALAPAEQAAGKQLSGLEVTGTAFVPRPSLAGRWGVQPRPHVKFDPATGAFELSCDGWQERAELTIAWKGKPEAVKRFSFVPEPDAMRTGVELTFP